ncbi:LCP family protein [Pectinatus cerevisiiphilus]|uniref:LytR family transcriptional attenuator n=1 Tax=Pectinatus cerevisiiphilus TaxID=86956 RepID=A0A4V2URP2_9FIRM|nr:LCP family protein [Pectinatus cerevisiiphilus]TCS78422.1 LytR family transcriptional attenuator [Pectinatus cerevisiiphilus]
MHKKKRKYLPIVILLLVFLVAAGCGAIFAGFLDDDKTTEVNQDSGMLDSADKATVMIMGVDARHDDVGRSDTLMIATIDPKKNQAALLSVPRDTRVKINGYGWDKINAAYAYGGYNLTRKTVEQLLAVPMDHYIIVNMEGFQKIIDAIGGVDIDVEKRMVYDDPWDDEGGLSINLYPGMQHMDGKTAVTYVRYRDEEGDIGRISRQQKFMKAVMDRILSPSIIPRIPSIIAEVFDAVKTDMSIRQLLAFFGSLKEAHDNGLKTDMVPGTPMYIEGISYWIPDITKLRQAMSDTLGIEMTSSMRAAMERTAAEYKDAIPSTAEEAPTSDSSVSHIQVPRKTPVKTETNKDKITDKSKSSTTTVPKSELREPSAGPQGQPAPANDVPSRGNQSIGKN